MGACLSSRFYFFLLHLAFLGLSLTAATNALAAGTKEKKAPVVTPSEPEAQMKFNTDRGSAPAPGQETFKFKAPGDASDIPATANSANPIETNGDGASYKTYIGFPKQYVGVNYAPSTYGGKYTYGGYDFNYSSTDLLGLDLNYKLDVNPRLFIEAEAGYHTAKTAGGSAGLTINESSISTIPFVFRTNYCWIGDNFFSKICPGVELGLDSYPVLGFINSTTLELQKVSEFFYGLNIYGQAPLIRSTLISGRIGYTMGSGSGQSGNLSSKKNNLLYLDSKIDWPMSEKSAFNIGLNYSLRTATIEGKVSPSLTDKWDTRTTQLIVKAGYTWLIGEQ